VQHQLLQNGQAFFNTSSLFYPVEQTIQGMYNFSSPYRPLVNDVSINGANVMSGVYLNGNFVTIGQSGLQYINHSKGTVTFNTPLPDGTQISGNFSVAEFDIRVADQVDYKVILNQKYAPNPMYNQVFSGLPEDVETFPAVILVPKKQENLNFSFAGVDNSVSYVRAITVCQNAFQRVAVNNILKNLKLQNLPYIINTSLDYLGNQTGTCPFNYSTATVSPYYNPVIMKATTQEIPEFGGFKPLTQQFGMCDLTISSFCSHT
jgi:hypothetical protein